MKRFPLIVLILCVSCLHAAEPVLSSGVDRAGFDMSVSPGTDFFQYVNGTWIKENPIPLEYSRWGAFPKLRDDNLIALRELVEGLNKVGLKIGPDARKLRDFYLTSTDEKKLDSQGIEPLREELGAIAKVDGKEKLLAEVAHLHTMGVGAIFSFHVGQDDKQSDRYAVHLWQDGLGLPERDYYLGTTDDSKGILAKYREHVAKILTLLGDTPEAAKAGADTVVAIETKLAEASRTPVALRDHEAQYNKKPLTELAALTPNWDWAAYLKAIEAKPIDYVIVGQPEFFQRINEMLASVPVEQWRVYFRWHLAHEAAPYMGGEMEKENFHFYSEVMRGVKEMQPRWKRGIRALDQSMGEALGRLYVEKYFTPAAKQRMDQLVKNVLAVYADRIKSRDWMGEETKKKALEKLAAVTPKIGYPDKWRDYSLLDIQPDSYVKNVLRAEAFQFRYRRVSRGNSAAAVL
jgi:putative endopeptidase